MERIVFIALFACLLLAGCVIEDDLCTDDEECGEGWTCDIVTGACLPIEDYDADSGNDQGLPDTEQSVLPDGTDSSDTAADADSADTTVDTDSVADKDTATDTDIATDKDTADSDSMADVDEMDDVDDMDTATDGDIVADTVTDTDSVVDDAAPDEDTDALLPDDDTSCTTCACYDCNGHGTCNELYGYPECICEEAYDGSWCQQCAYGWQDHDGNDTCEKDDCAHATAPGTGWLDCGAHGTCDDWGGSVPADCDCDTYWIDQSGGECNYCWASDPNDCNL